MPRGTRQTLRLVLAIAEAVAIGACAEYPTVAAAAAAAAPPQAAAPTVLHLSQSAERQIPRDRIRVDMRTERTADDPRAVEGQINARMAKAVATAHETPGITAATGSYTVYRIMPPRGGPPQWTGAQSLSLTGPDAGALLKLAGQLEAAGLVMSNLAYEVSRATVRGTEDALTAEALVGLQRRAAAIAQQLHLVVAGYRDLTVGNAQGDQGPRPFFAAAAAATRAAMPAPVGAPGEATVSVAVSADILLAPK